MSKEYKNTAHFRKLLYIFIIAILLVNLYRIYVEYKWDNIGLDDHAWIWSECRVAFWHYSPYELLANGTEVNGVHMEAHISSLPWGLVSGLVMHGAFLPYEASCIWYVTIRLLVVLLTAVLVWRYLRRKSIDQSLCMLAMLSIPATWYAIDCISKGNNGEIICLLIICSICVLDEHPVLAGIWMIFAMFKPQTALPFFVVFLLLKKYQTIATSVIGVLATWGLSAIWTHTNPVAQLQGVIKFANTMEASYHVVGILDPIRKIGVSSSVAMLCSMLTGLILMCVCLGILHRKFGLSALAKEHAFFVYAFPAITSVMWCYKSAQDYMILLLVVFAMYELWNDKQDVLQFVLCLFLLGSMMTKPFSTALLGRLPMLDVYMCNRMDLTLKTLGMPILVWFYIRREKWFD